MIHWLVKVCKSCLFVFLGNEMLTVWKIQTVPAVKSFLLSQVEPFGLFATRQGEGMEVTFQTSFRTKVQKNKEKHPEYFA